MQNQNTETPKKIVWIIWMALLISQFIYIAILIFQDKLNGITKSDMIYVSTMGMMALSITMISEFFWKKTKVSTSKESQRNGYSPEHFTNTIITWVLGESIAIYGFVLAFLDKAEPAIVYSFFALSISLHLYRKPR